MLVRVGRTITIAGGGLAGLSLGLLLRREGVPVEIWDAGAYPRHRVCGEFISGSGVRILHELGLAELPEPLGIRAQSVQFFHLGWSSPVFSLPEAALSIDRSTLDNTLAKEFRKRGGVLHENQRWTDGFNREGLVRATGRRLASEGGGHFIGLKVHAQDLPLGADLELHFADGAYVGLSRQRNGTVNVCGLFRKRNGFCPSKMKSGHVFEEVLSGPARERFGAAGLNPESFSAVAGISLKREDATGAKECRIGDSICMIPPLTGNGMSLALESAALSAPFLRDYSEGRISWGEARKGISQVCDEAFRRRLFAAAILQKMVFTPAARRALMYLLRTTPLFFRLWFRLTR
jgi:menaquinone-9 beta-reductase